MKGHQRGLRKYPVSRNSRNPLPGLDLERIEAAAAAARRTGATKQPLLTGREKKYPTFLFLLFQIPASVPHPS